MTKEIALLGVNGTVLSDTLTALLEKSDSVDVFSTTPEHVMLDTTNIVVNHLDTSSKEATRDQLIGFDTVVLALENDMGNPDFNDWVLRTYSETVNAIIEAGVKRLFVIGAKDSEAFYCGELRRHDKLDYVFTTTEGDYADAVAAAVNNLQVA